MSQWLTYLVPPDADLRLLVSALQSVGFRVEVPQQRLGSPSIEIRWNESSEHRERIRQAIKTALLDQEEAGEIEFVDERSRQA